MGKHGTKRTAKATRPKSKLGLPDLDHSMAAELESLRSPESKRGYRRAIDEFIQWYCSEPRLSFSKVVVTRFWIARENRGLAAGTINGRLAAVRRLDLLRPPQESILLNFSYGLVFGIVAAQIDSSRVRSGPDLSSCATHFSDGLLAYEAADAGLLSPDLAAGIRRVKGVKKLGVRLGNWLTADEARRLWQAPDANTLKGKRDRAILAVLLGCGLRRRELADLDFTHLQQREEHWAIVDLVGKGGHIRTVPVPDWVKATVDAWVAAAELETGKLFRCVCRAGKCWSDGVTKRLVWHVVKQYAGELRLQGRRAPWPEALVREIVPCGRRRAGADPILARPCLGPDHRTLSRLQTTDPRSGQRSDRH